MNARPPSRLLLAALPLVLASARGAAAGDVDVEAMAAPILEALPRLGQRPVLLFPAAPKVAAEVATAITGTLATHDAVLLSFERLDRVLAQRHLTLDDLIDPRIALLVAEVAGAEALLQATVPPESDEPELILRLLRVPGGEVLAQAWAPLASEPCLSRRELARANTPGVVAPQCASCPPAPWPAVEGVPDRAATTPMVDFIVTKDGRACDIRLRKPRNQVVDQAAVRQVRTYRFKPATRNGEPIPALWWLWVHFQK